jgi:hypothetical protein
MGEPGEIIYLIEKTIVGLALQCPPYKQLRLLMYPLPDSKTQKNNNATGGS